jgi:hypothetical protein
VNSEPSPFSSVQSKRGSDSLVVAIDDAVFHVTAAQVFENGDQPIESRQSLHGGREHDHQLAALLRHVTFEHRLEIGIDFEEPPIEEGRDVVGNRGDYGERLLNELNLRHGRHGRFSLDTQCDVSRQSG